MEYIPLSNLQFTELQELLPRHPKLGETCLDIPKDRFKEFLAKGSFGMVYDCEGAGCNKIMKVVPYKSAKLFAYEVWISVKAGDLGIGPKIYGAFTCNNFGFMIMQKLKCTLNALLKTNISYAEKFSVLVDGYEKILLARTNKICHCDLHWDNVMVDENNKFYLIDYGYAFIGDHRTSHIEKYYDKFDLYMHQQRVLAYLSNIPASDLESFYTENSNLFKVVVITNKILDSVPAITNHYLHALAIPPLAHEILGTDVKYWSEGPFDKKISKCLSNLCLTNATGDPTTSLMSHPAFFKTFMEFFDAYNMKREEFEEMQNVYEYFRPMLNWK